MIAGRALLAAGAALPLLSGCVAAAIPVLAAGGVFGTQVRGDREAPAASAAPRVSVDTTAPNSAGAATAGTVVRNYTLADGTRMEVMTGPLDAAPASSEPPSAPLTRAQIEPVAPRVTTIPQSFTLADGTRATIVSGGLPAPTPADAFATAGRAYDALSSFAAQQGALPVAGSERRSALLADPDALAPVTRECSIHPAAVLVDLDPAGGMLDAGAAVHADRALAGKLAELRAQGIAIGWISANTADRAGAVRRALVASGLDPAGHDELALLRYPEERKQTRRADFAKEFCVVAIAGDDRADFDELFQYLKDKSLAAPLDALIGNGWFLIPQPLT
jgi:hypothetical protein